MRRETNGLPTQPSDLWSFNFGWLQSHGWTGYDFFSRNYQWGMWFRVFGYGLIVRKRAGHKPLFSESNGHRRVWMVGPVKVYPLAPDTL